jgi:bla regulator protein BlaR1
MGSRDTTMQLVAVAIYSYGVQAGEVDKLVVDQTGLDGTYDFTVEWNGRLPGAPPPGAAAPSPPDPQGTTFLQAVRDQLGLRLVSTKAPVRMLVVDHVDRPSEN